MDELEVTVSALFAQAFNREIFGQEPRVVDRVLTDQVRAVRMELNVTIAHLQAVWANYHIIMLIFFIGRKNVVVNCRIAV